MSVKAMIKSDTRLKKQKLCCKMLYPVMRWAMHFVFVHSSQHKEVNISPRLRIQTTLEVIWKCMRPDMIQSLRVSLTSFVPLFHCTCIVFFKHPALAPLYQEKTSAFFLSWTLPLHFFRQLYSQAPAYLAPFYPDIYFVLLESWLLILLSSMQVCGVMENKIN